MTRIFLTIAFAAAVAMGCDSTDTGNDGGVGGEGGAGGGGGAGGEGGSIGPLTWVSSGMQVVGDTCNEFFVPEEALEFEMTIEGNALTMALTDTPLVMATDDYMETDDEVTVTDRSENSNNDPCIVQLDNALQMGLDDPDVSIDQNSTLSVSWFHVEEELSTDECEGVWFADLPCEGEASLTLTQSPAP